MHLLLIQSKPALLGNGLAERPQDQRSVYAIPRQTDESRDHPVAFKQRSNSVKVPFKQRSNGVQMVTVAADQPARNPSLGPRRLGGQPPAIPLPGDGGIPEP